MLYALLLSAAVHHLQLPALLQGMSITPPSVRKTAAPAEAAEASSGSPSDQVADNGDIVGVPVAGHDLVDLCENDDSEDVQDEQQPQSQELPQQPSPWRQNFSDTQQDQQQDKEGSPEADHAVPDLQQTTGAVGLEPQQEQQQQQQQQRDEALRDEAYSIVIELHTEDPSSLDYLTRSECWLDSGSQGAMSDSECGRCWCSYLLPQS